MPDAALTSAPPLDLSELRAFVTLTHIEDLAEHLEAAAGYFRRFRADDDATLVVYAPCADPVHATAIVRRVIALAGRDLDDCAHATLCLVDDDWRTLDRLARRAHCVLGRGSGEWLPIARTAYDWSAIADLRRQAERAWDGERIAAAYSYEAAIGHLVARGWTTDFHARGGSIPEPSMDFIASTLDAHLGPAPRILHVGNFLGVSLAYLLDWARDREGSVVSVDPDLPHRGVDHPQRAVNDLLAHFGLTERHLLVCGYSLEKCFSNDSVVFEGYDPAHAWAREAAPENVLPALLASGLRFDAALMDGNHDPRYLRREVAVIADLLVPGGILVLDDVDEWWEGVREVFREIAGADGPFAPVGMDGRVGVLRRS